MIDKEEEIDHYVFKITYYCGHVNSGLMRRKIIEYSKDDMVEMLESVIVYANKLKELIA